MNVEGASRATTQKANMPPKNIVLLFSIAVSPKGPFLCGSLWTDLARIDSLTAATT
jgi:hypothetical protein